MQKKKIKLIKEAFVLLHSLKQDIHLKKNYKNTRKLSLQ